MKLSRTLALAAAAAGLALMAVPALAQNTWPTLNYGNAYGGLEVGGVIPDDIGETLSGSTTGIANLSFKNGVAVGGFESLASTTPPTTWTSSAETSPGLAQGPSRWTGR